jgi:hypothetical protein
MVTRSDFERSLPSDLIRGWVLLRAKKTRHNRDEADVVSRSKGQRRKLAAFSG